MSKTFAAGKGLLLLKNCKCASVKVKLTTKCHLKLPEYRAIYVPSFIELSSFKAKLKNIFTFGQINQHEEIDQFRFQGLNNPAAGYKNL